MSVSFKFQGRTAVVTGASRGIGRTVSELLLQSGANVWNWDKEPIEIPGIQTACVDVTIGETITHALEQIAETPVDILVNSAGYLGPYQSFETMAPSEWQRIIQINLVGMMEVTLQVLPSMRRSAFGRIVNFGSLAGKEGLPNLAVYSAASAGVIASQRPFPARFATRIFGSIALLPALSTHG